MNPFAPGIVLMQRLKFAEKFALVCLLFTIPLILTSYDLFRDMQQDVQRMQKRQMGLAYLNAVTPLLELITRHRGMVNSLLLGDTSFRSKLTGLEKALQQAMTQARQANQQWGEALSVHHDWHHIQKQWQKLHTASLKMTAEQNWLQHTDLIVDYLQLIYKAVVTSTLFTTEDTALRHLTEMNFHHLPQLIETLGRLRGRGAGFLTDHAITPDEKQELALLTENVTNQVEKVDRQWRFALEGATDLPGSLADMHTKVQQSVWSYAKFVHQQIDTPHPIITASRFFKRGTTVITVAYQLLHHSTAYQQQSFDQHSAQLIRHMFWLRVLLFATTLLTAYLVTAFYLSTRRTTRQLQFTLQHIQQRKVPKLSQEVGRDEMADVVRIFNELSRDMIHKNEEDRLLGELSTVALRCSGISMLCDRILVLLMGAHRILGTKSPAHIQLLRKSGRRYIAAASYDDATVLTIPDATSKIYQLSFGDNPLYCLPLVHQGRHLGELILTLDNGVQMMNRHAPLFERIVDILVIAIVRLQSMQELQEREEALLRSNAELERFAYVASHDLQEPLRKICSFGDRLRAKSGLEGRNLDFLIRMTDAAARMQLLIQDLLIFSRIQSTTRPFSTVDLNKVVQHAVDNLEVAIHECSGTVVFSELPTIEGDPVQLEQLFQNLIGNAVKYRRPEASPYIQIALIREETRDDGERMFHFECRDNGIGFEQKYADQIFEAFKRLHGRREYSGSGIGLAVCRRIVERHGGTIFATSVPNQGTCIRFSLQARHPRE